MPPENSPSSSMPDSPKGNTTEEAAQSPASATAQSRAMTRNLRGEAMAVRGGKEEI